jgi:hypothetical protein
MANLCHETAENISARSSARFSARLWIGASYGDVRKTARQEFDLDGEHAVFT